MIESKGIKFGKIKSTSEVIINRFLAHNKKLLVKKMKYYSYFHSYGMNK